MCGLYDDCQVNVDSEERCAQADILTSDRPEIPVSGTVTLRPP